jgi:hypothetical protein
VGLRLDQGLLRPAHRLHLMAVIGDELQALIYVNTG